MPTNEASLVTAVCKAVAQRYPKAWIFKVVGNPYQMAGVPDLLICVEGRLYGIEVKFAHAGESDEAARERATPVQRAQIRRLREAGAVADVVTSVQEVLDLLEER